MALITLFGLVILVGGMVTFQVLFAPLLFTQLSKEQFSVFIRAFFPWYYLFFGLINGVLVFTFWFADNNNLIHLALCSLCFVGFVVSRQYLMPKANEASDNGDLKRFAIYHRSTVVINTIQLAVFIYLLWPTITVFQ
ncbi:hypothetical protein CS022_18450 [Veronia nyctiphanis]|uniref:TMEM205-like domain-containing protein n=1 Tax=Veronia nyctiphanis TaxID=1278244 RepID=A0A4Q0YMC6_9GAMM|nr:DUF4149 domain-containing protein [Veronia nyctiphanis]RXJ71980.1 hypothetical protein CS022_18450 [Veronia nyctiphanis]